MGKIARPPCLSTFPSPRNSGNGTSFLNERHRSRRAETSEPRNLGKPDLPSESESNRQKLRRQLIEQSIKHLHRPGTPRERFFLPGQTDYPNPSARSSLSVPLGPGERLLDPVFPLNSPIAFLTESIGPKTGSGEESRGNRRHSPEMETGAAGARGRARAGRDKRKIGASVPGSASISSAFFPGVNRRRYGD